MDSTIKSITKSLVLQIPYAREKYFQREFLKRSPSCRGIYDSFAEAAQDAPSSKLGGYDHRVITEFYRAEIGDLDPNDYPVLFWLARTLPEVEVVYDLGGNVGVGFYAYRRYMPYPEKLRWVVIELPEAVRAGKEIALERKESQLVFTEQRQVEDNPDLYVTLGALQYIEDDFARIIVALRKKPAHLLISRIPLTTGDAFITLQNNGLWFSPYKVDNKAEFIKSVEAIGYELIDNWQMDRANFFLLNVGEVVPSYHGMYFRLKN